jgi:alkylation response protein AidB-like acyl-CoA dehydrogenase
MVDYRPPVDDLRFILNEVLDWQGLLTSAAYTHVDGALGEAVLEEAAKVTRRVLAPINQPGDEQGSSLRAGRVITPDGFRDAYRHYAEGGWIGLDLPREHGGQDLPLVLQAAVAEMVNGACVAFAMLPLMQRAAARLLIAHGDPQTVQRIVPHLAAGDWAATICISEAQAGSDVGRIRTMARPVADGVYALSGTKIFITFGDHDLTEQICHIVLARTPGAAPGTRGLSLFVVPKVDFESGQANGVSVSRVEHKMGLRASPTCVVDFGDARGWRIGAEGEGLKVLFTMVNTMRLEVAMQGVAVAGAATGAALAYAAERPQGGPPDAPAVPIINHVDVRRMLMIMRARTGAMRALVLEAAFQLDRAKVAGSAEAREDARLLAQWLLPVCKVCGSQAGFEVANLAVQVLGGHGYVSDAGVEQYVRDSRVMAIYEGANGIQALDLVTRKLARGEGRHYDIFAARIRADLDAAEQSPIRRAVADGLARLDRLKTLFLERMAHTPRDGEAGAGAYLALVGLVGGGWMWLRMAQSPAPGREGRQALATFYADYLMAEVETLEARARLNAAVFDSLTAEQLAAY